MKRCFNGSLLVLAFVALGSGCCCTPQPCGPRGGCLTGMLGCASGCGDTYVDEWCSDPPQCCDPCDNCGNWVGEDPCCHPLVGSMNWLFGIRYVDGCCDDGCSSCCSSGPSCGSGCSSCGSGGHHHGEEYWEEAPSPEPELAPTPAREMVQRSRTRRPLPNYARPTNYRRTR